MRKCEKIKYRWWSHLEALASAHVMSDFDISYECLRNCLLVNIVYTIFLIHQLFFFFFKSAAYSHCDCKQARSHIMASHESHLSLQLMIFKSANGCRHWVYGVVVLLDGIICRENKQFLAGFRFNCKLQATCCAIMFGSHVFRSLYYRLAAFSNQCWKTVAKLL